MRERARALDIKVIPWARLANTLQGDTLALIKSKLALLILTANTWDDDTILPNYENEAEKIPPGMVGDILYDELGWNGLTGWSTNGWLGSDLDFSPLSADPALLQIFPTDLRWNISDIPQKMGDCVYHARELGFNYVGVTYQTYDNARPVWYDCASHMHSTYPGNLIANGDWGKWYQ